MFRRSFRPSSGVQERTYSIGYMSYRFVDCMLVSGCPLACSQRTCMIYDVMLYVRSWTPDDGRKDRPKHAECYSINSKNCASSWFYYGNKTLISNQRRNISASVIGEKLTFCLPVVFLRTYSKQCIESRHDNDTNTFWGHVSLPNYSTDLNEICYQVSGMNILVWIYIWFGGLSFMEQKSNVIKFPNRFSEYRIR